jgi:hypothetical protein
MRRVTSSARTRRFVLFTLLASSAALNGCLFDGGHNHHHGDRWDRWRWYDRDHDGRSDGRSGSWNGDVHHHRGGDRY